MNEAGIQRTQADAPSHGEPRNPRLALFASAAFDLIVPLAVYYILRQNGVPLLTAAIIGGIVPVVRTVYVFARYRKIDGLGLFMVTMMVIGTAVSLISGDARFFFAKDGWLTAMFGIWMLITLFFEKPFFLHAGVSIARTKRGGAGAEVWERRWDTEPRMRHGLRLLTVVFGVGMIVDAVVRVVLAYTLPLDDINLVTTVQWIVVLGGLIGFMAYYTRKHDLRA
ncbi:MULTISPECIES: VC0807 family protein [unclassified Amycolatopsis]|uniref:VC0807 family protein n=1 Tax=unclassified Amycolatopsis TaxID=2618356 RepID=UPI002876C5F4|nr:MULTISPECIES: VC0807 family protein [unclassified Amycolatopsis]MDS0136261.1 hypothetical protein [Amycolatopsis sp. 505]MDS0145776.1 hypothetical protein [Amycolatopsis sp. CM201R]